MDIKAQIEEVLNKHKGLQFQSERNIISGKIFLPSGDNYEIKMDLTLFPRLFPIVYEIGGRIPNKLHRHMYVDIGACCFTTRAKAQVLLKTKVSTLLLFIDEIVIRYFENNSYYEINGKYLFDEHDHGVMGILEGYQDILNVNDNKAIVSIIVKRLENNKLRLKHQCYCFSGQTLKKCHSGLHSKHYRTFKLVDKEILKSDLALITNFLNIKL